MAASYFDLSVPTFLQTVRAVGGWLDKAAVHCAEIGTDPDDFVIARLIDDMAAFHFQSECVDNYSVWGLEAVKHGMFNPPNIVGAVPFSDLQKRITETQAVLEEFNPDEVNAWSGKKLDIEPLRVCRRLQLLSRMEHHEQDDEQVFPEVRERAVRLVLDNREQHESRWSAILSISSKIGCAPQTLNEWIKKAEVESGERTGVTTEMAEKMKALERENRELKQANEILRKGEAIVRHWSEDNGRARILLRRSSIAGPEHDRLHPLPDSVFAKQMSREGKRTGISGASRSAG